MARSERGNAPHISAGAPMNAAARSLLDVRALPRSREVLAYRDGGLFPILAITPEGTIVAAARGGAGHLGREGRIEVIRSLDAGEHWSSPAVVVDSDWDDRDYAFGVSAAGTLVLAYHRSGCYDADGHYRPERYDEGDDAPAEARVTRSRDGGLTWERPAPLSLAALRTSNPYGKIVALADGTLLLAIYGRPRAELLGARGCDLPAGGYSSYLLRSRDDGRTWGEPSVIGVGSSETGLIVLPDGDLLAVLRGDAPNQWLAVARSTDGGATWSEPVPLTENGQHPADLVALSNGDVLLTYGNRNPPYRIEGRVSRDGGRSWLDLLLTFSGPLYGSNVAAPRPTDLGYPSTVVHRATGPGRGVTIYYYNPSLWHPGDWRTGERGALYRSEDYRAVAVGWDEAELLAAIAARTAS